MYVKRWNTSYLNHSVTYPIPTQLPQHFANWTDRKLAHFPPSLQAWAGGRHKQSPIRQKNIPHWKREHATCIELVGFFKRLRGEGKCPHKFTLRTGWFDLFMQKHIRLQRRVTPPITCKLVMCRLSDEQATWKHAGFTSLAVLLCPFPGRYW